MSTLAELGTHQLTALMEAVGASSPAIAQASQIFVTLLGPAAQRPTGGAPPYPSDVVDDHTPYELSVTLGEASSEVRLLVETIDRESSLAARWRAGRAAGRLLAERHGADLRRLDQIAELFEPRDEDGLLALWHAVSFRPGAAPEFKVYLDLRARGTEQARAVLEEALARLDLASAYPRLLREAGRRDLLDELVYLSLDLAAHDRARVKVYFRHHRATAAELAPVIGELGGARPGEVERFCTQVLGHGGPYLARPLVSCWAFSGGAEPPRVMDPRGPAVRPEPSGATLYAPVAYYAHDDGEARSRVRGWLDEIGLPRAHYERCLDAFARRPLDAGIGMQSYVSFKRDRGAAKATVYLAPEAYQTFAPGTLAARRLPAPTRPQSPEDLVHWYDTVERVSDHPLFRRLASEPPALGPLWTILANNWVAVGDRFPRWLASLVARLDDDRMRSILVKQLNDELGDGDPERAHRLLFQTMLADLEPYAPAGDRDALLAPGRRFAESLAHNYLERPALEAIGGTLVAEVFGKQVDQSVGALLRRQRDLDPASLTWLVLHETLEEDHADESRVLARMTPPDADARAAVCRGAEELAALGSRYFDDLYEVVFP